MVLSCLETNFQKLFDFEALDQVLYLLPLNGLVNAEFLKQRNEGLHCDVACPPCHNPAKGSHEASTALLVLRNLTKRRCLTQLGSLTKLRYAARSVSLANRTSMTDLRCLMRPRPMTASRSLTESTFLAESRSLTKWDCSTKKQLISWLHPERSCLKTGPTCA